MKRRDFLKSVLGAIGGLTGANAIKASEAPIEELPEIEKPISTFHTWEGGYGLYADGSTREIPINFTFDKTSAKLLSENENVITALRTVLGETRKV